jgi:hypothetical protein
MAAKTMQILIQVGILSDIISTEEYLSWLNDPQALKSIRFSVKQLMCQQG